MSLAAAIACLLVGEADHRGDRAEDLLLEQPRVLGHAAEHGRLVEVAGAVAARAADHDVARPCRSRPRPARRPCRAASRRSAGRPRRPPRCRGRPSSRPSSPASFSVNSSRTASATWKRLAAVHASPMLRILAIIAPSTAASTSASSKTRNGALPPSSIDVRSSPSADCSTSLRPTSVEPVKVSLRSRGSEMIGFETSPEDFEVTTLSTPAGQPGLLEDLRQREHRQRRLLRGLDDHRAAGGDRRADLARAHRHREVPRRDRVARPDGLAHRDQPPGAVRARSRSGPRCARPPRRTSGRTPTRR